MRTGIGTSGFGLGPEYQEGLYRPGARRRDPLSGPGSVEEAEALHEAAMAAGVPPGVFTGYGPNGPPGLQESLPPGEKWWDHDHGTTPPVIR